MLLARPSRFILVPKIADVQELYQLSWQDQQQFLNESSVLSEVLMQTFNGDKMNIAALGNVVEQLHIHHVVRFKSDVCWPKPIWGQKKSVPYTTENLTALKSKLLPKLNHILSIK